MKTRILRTVCFAFVTFLMSGFVVKAQEAFYDTKWEDGKMVSRTKYVEKYSGLYEQESLSEYTYDENGELLKKEVYVWNPKYRWNNKKGSYYPDYSESNWRQQYCIRQKKDLGNNIVSLELLIWNKSGKAYGEPVEKQIYQLNNQNLLDYLAFQKSNKYIEEINKINFNKELLAEFIGRAEN